MKIPLLAVVAGVATVSRAAPTRVPDDQQLVTEVTYDSFYDDPNESLSAIACSVGLHAQVPQSELNETSKQETYSQYHATVFIPERRRLRDLPAFPHTAAGVVRRAEHSRMDLVLGEFPLHILEIHAPHTGFIEHERRMDDWHRRAA